MPDNLGLPLPFHISLGIGLLNVLVTILLVVSVVKNGMNVLTAFALIVNIVGGAMCLFSAYGYWRQQ